MGDTMGTRLLGAIGARAPQLTVWQYEDAFDTRVPCQHDAFSFHVTVREVWSRTSRFDDLGLVVAARKEAHRATIRRRLRAISRGYRPDASAAVEQIANEQLGRPESVADELGLTCTCSFEATPDQELVDKLRQVELERLTVEAGDEATARRLERLERIEGRWLNFLRQLGRDPLGPAIARLAGSEDLAGAIAEFGAQQEQITKDLRDLCDTATEAYREKGLYEFAMTTDNAFSRLLQHISQEPASSVNGDGLNGHRPRPAP
jgi:hypothetical protein